MMFLLVLGFIEYLCELFGLLSNYHNSSVAFHSLVSHALRTQHARGGVMSGDDMFSAPKASWSFSNSDLEHLQHSLDCNCLPVLEMLQSTSYSEPLPAVPNTTVHSSHSNHSPTPPLKAAPRPPPPLKVTRRPLPTLHPPI